MIECYQLAVADTAAGIASGIFQFHRLERDPAKVFRSVFPQKAVPANCSLFRWRPNPTLGNG
jgi:hypothetical protein